MQCKMTRNEKEKQKNEADSMNENENDKKGMKKEKRRNMRSTEAGAHDVFVILSIRRETLRCIRYRATRHEQVIMMGKLRVVKVR